MLLSRSPPSALSCGILLRLKLVAGSPCSCRLHHQQHRRRLLYAFSQQHYLFEQPRTSYLRSTANCLRSSTLPARSASTYLSPPQPQHTYSSKVRSHGSTGHQWRQHRRATSRWHMRTTPAATSSTGGAGGPPPPRRVLLTNDDGPDSPFFKPWVTQVQQVLRWSTYVCTPAVQQSFVGKSISKGPIQVNDIDADHVTLRGGTPATCVNIALHNLAAECDFVIAGPNIGHNLGRASVLSSGTIGAAMEGALAGRRAVAISFPFFNGWNNWTDADIQDAVHASGEVVQQLWRDWPAGGAADAEVYNINVPLHIHVGQKNSYDIVTSTVDPTSQYSSLYALGGEEGKEFTWSPKGLKVFEVPAPQPGGDVEAVKAGNISVTPLRTGFVAA